MGNRKRNPQGEISAYRPGLVEGLTDALLGAPLRQLHRATGASERDAYRRTSDTLREIENVTGFQQAERSVRNIFAGRGTGGDYVTAGLMALPLAGRAAPMVRRALRAAPSAATPVVRNSLYREGILGGNYAFSDPSLPKYAYRNVASPAEMDDLARSGYMRPRSEGGQKYFTASDAEVPSAGNRGAGRPILRVETRHIAETSPVKRQHVRMWDEATQSWVPVPGKAEGGEVKADAYRLWLEKHGVRESDDYDTRAAFEAGLTPSENGHLPDTYKLPNHITFSTESKYARAKGAPPAGRWEGSDEKGWAFYASPTNIKNAGGIDALQEYFRKYEPNSRLILPDMKASGGVVIDDGNPAKRRKLI